MEEDTSLIKLNEVDRAIQEAATVQEVKATHSMLESMRVYAQQQQKGEEIKIQIAEYILKAESKLGEIIKTAKAAGQITKGHATSNRYGKFSSDVVSDDNTKTTLSDAKISRDLSSRAQKIASIPKEDLKKIIEEKKATGKAENLTPNKIVEASKKKKSKTEKSFQPFKGTEQVMALYEKGLTQSKIASSTGISKDLVRRIVEREEVRKQGEQKANAEIPREILSLSAQAKLDRAIRQEKERLGREFRAAVIQQVNAELKIRLDGISERWQAEQNQAKRIMNARKGFMPKRVFRLIVSCLHPDKFDQIVSLIGLGKLEEINSMKANHSDAFRMFKQFEKFILDEKESPTAYVPLPRTVAEWTARKEEAIKAARAKREEALAKKAAAIGGIQTTR